MIKIKIFNLLPYWLIALILLTAIQAGVIIISQQNSNKPITLNALQASGTPQVLGAATSIRGDAAASAVQNITEITNPDLSNVTAKSFLVFDLASGQELMQKSSKQKLYIASLTKLLTGFVAYQNIDFSQSITVAKNDLLKVAPDLGFTAGDSVTASDVFNAMLIGSCNDAALTLGNFVSGKLGKNFPDLMNQQAQALGMASSHFSNPMGFDGPNNYSTAEDLKTLITATEALAVFKNLGRRTAYEFTGSLGQNYSTVATNKLISDYPDIQAIKTGFTYGAQGAMATKITIGSHEIVVIVLDSQNREGDTLKLRTALLDNFKWE